MNNRVFVPLPLEFDIAMGELKIPEWGRLIKSLLLYYTTGVEKQYINDKGEQKELEGTEAVLWPYATMRINQYLDYYDKKSEDKQVRAKKGAAARWSADADTAQAQQAMLNDAQAQQAMLNDACDAKNKNININENENINKNKKNIKENSCTNVQEQKKSGTKVDVFAEFAEETGGGDELLTAFRDFEEMRKSIEKPMTDRAKTMLCDKLKAEFNPSDWINVLNQSVINSWQSVCPLKTDGKKQTVSTGRTYTDQQSNVQDFDFAATRERAKKQIEEWKKQEAEQNGD